MRERLCACSHEQARHALVDGERRGACLHGCGCEAFHGRRRGETGRRFVSPATEQQPSIAVALAAIEKARSALHEAEVALRSAPGTLRIVPPRVTTSAGSVRGERRILIAVAQHRDGVTREQLTVLTGYKRSSRDTYLQRLRAHRLLDDADRIRVTSEGIAFLGSDYKPLPTGDELVRYWRQRLPAGELVILDALLTMWPRSVDREALTTSTGYRRSSRDTYLQRLRSRELVRVMPDGAIALSEVLMQRKVEGA